MVDIIGGGILGLTLAFELQKTGRPVRIWERSATLGGLMGRTSFAELDGMSCDRYYHAILNSDRTLMGLMDELGLKSRLRMVATKMGFYHAGRCHPMTTPLEFMRFPPLSMLDRLRLASTILACRRIKDWHTLEQIPVAEWLTGLSGERVVQNIWSPLLRAKFDGDFSQVPATYIWSRLVRTTDTRTKGGSQELMCYLPGGYQELVDALANAVRQAGGTITTGATVEQVRVADGRVVGVLVDGQELPAEQVVITTQTPVARRLLPPEAAEVNASWGRLDGYLGIVCMLLVLRRSLTPYYTLNITDPSIPFTGVIETTNLIDPACAGGYHLVYLPKYVAPGSPYATMPDDELRTVFLGHLRTMFPDLRDEEIAAIRIGRERYVEPLHPVGATDRIPQVRSAVPGLFLANTGQIYPQLTNGESVCAFARRVAHEVSSQSAVAQTPEARATIAVA